MALADHNHRDATDLEDRGWPGVHRFAGGHALGADKGAVKQATDARLGGEGQRQFLGFAGVKRRLDHRPLAGRHRPRHQGRVEKRRQRAAGNPRGMEGREDIGGVATSTAPRIVGRVGEQKRRRRGVGAHRASFRRRFLDGNHAWAIALTVPPCRFGQFNRHLFGPRRVVTRGDHHRQAIFGCVGEGESRDRRDIHDLVIDHRLAALDQIAVGIAVGGQLGDRGRDQRQAHAITFRSQAGHHLTQGTRRLDPALVQIDMGIGAVPDH